MSWSGHREFEMGERSLPSTTMFGNVGPGRIYVTSPGVGIDLSVDSVQADFQSHNELRSFDVDGWRGGCRVSPSFSMGYEWELRLRFQMPSLAVRYPVKNSGVRGLQEFDPEGRVYLLDHGKPIPPRLPIWLPPGLWKCCHCDCLQNEGLLQCRSCGATRFEAVTDDGSRSY